MKSDGATNILLKLCTAAAIAAAPSGAIAQDAAKKPAPAAAAAAAKKKPATPPKPITEVKKEDFKVSVSLSAVFESTKLTPVSVKPEAWGDLTIKSIVPHGTAVKKGTRLVELDLEKLDEQITALEAAEKTARLTLDAAIDSLDSLEKTTPMSLEAARRTKRQADENFEYWVNVSRKRDEDSYERNVKSSKRGLEYAQEELNQLQKMYDEDDLTEETEEIILKRAKASAEQAEYYLKRAIQSRDYALNTSIPRSHQSNVNGHKQAQLSFELAMRSIPRALELKKLEVAKAKIDAGKNSKKLRDLKRDRKLLSNITAPTEGTVYYGTSVLGNWTSATVAKKLIKGGKLTPKAEFMTIVGDGGLRLQTAIPEDKLASLKSGARGHVTPVSNPLLRIPARLGKINYANSPVGFKTTANIDAPEGSRLMPGMKGKLVFHIADRKNVLTVPVTAVSSEGGKSFVFVSKDDADPEKREVKIAETDGKKVAILKGLTEKDKVLTVAP